MKSNNDFDNEFDNDFCCLYSVLFCFVDSEEAKKQKLNDTLVNSNGEHQGMLATSVS